MKHRKEEEAQKRRGKDRGLKILALIYLIAMLAIIFFTAAEAGAKTRGPEFTSLTKAADGELWEDRHLFIIKNGKIQMSGLQKAVKARNWDAALSFAEGIEAALRKIRNS